jgi:hypothetical protein
MSPAACPGHRLRPAMPNAPCKPFTRSSPPGSLSVLFDGQREFLTGRVCASASGSWDSHLEVHRLLSGTEHHCT